MSLFSRILFPVAVTAFAAAGVLGIPGQARNDYIGARNDYAGVSSSRTAIRDLISAPLSAAGNDGFSAPDTVVYPTGGYKLRRTLSLEEITVRDTSGEEILDSVAVTALDTVVRLSPRDSFKAQLDTSLWGKLDSLWIVDSTARAKAAFEAWYAGLSPQERRAYDAEQKAQQKLARMDSLGKARQERTNIRDSIAETTPRILESYVLPDSLYYKRIVAWKQDPDFGKVSAYIPDTTYNYHFHDYPFRRQDVNASWLGVAGSPVQYYNWFLRRSDEVVEFYDAQ